MTSATQKPATLDDLDKVEGKAELIGGRIVAYGPGEYIPATIAFNIAISLHEYTKKVERGDVFTSGIADALHPPLKSGRQSISPDVSFYDGPPPANRMSFIKGPPTFAVEVRGQDDHGESSDTEREAKRADYFEAGTLIVWDVDPMAKSMKSYRGDPAHPVAVFATGQVAEAEPAVPNWRVAVDELFVQA